MAVVTMASHYVLAVSLLLLPIIIKPYAFGVLPSFAGKQMIQSVVCKVLKFSDVTPRSLSEWSIDGCQVTWLPC